MTRSTVLLLLVVTALSNSLANSLAAQENVTPDQDRTLRREIAHALVEKFGPDAPQTLLYLKDQDDLHRLQGEVSVWQRAHERLLRSQRQPAENLEIEFARSELIRSEQVLDQIRTRIVEIRTRFVDTKSTRRMLETLEKEAESRENEVIELREKLRKLTEDVAGRMDPQVLAQLTGRMTGSEVELAVLRAQHASLKHRASGRQIDENALERMVANHPAVHEIKAEYQQLQAKLEAARPNPKLIEMFEKEMKVTQAKLEQLRDVLRKEMIGQGVEQKLASLEEQIKAKQVELTVLREQLDRALQQVRQGRDKQPKR